MDRNRYEFVIQVWLIIRYPFFVSFVKSKGILFRPEL